MNNENIVNSIKELCKSKNITVGQLEKDVGLSQGLVSKWMNTTPSLDKIVDIADYFHVSIDEVVGRNLNIDDEFFNILYNNTKQGIIKWSKDTVYNQISDTFFIKLENRLFNHDYNDELESAFYSTNFGEGTIFIYVHCKKEIISKPIKICLYIQPNAISELIDQQYDEKLLQKLWIEVLRSCGDTPSEIMVEDFKNDFIKKFKSLNNNETKLDNLCVEKFKGRPLSFYSEEIEE